MEAEERLERFEDMQLAFASVMGSDKDGELSAALEEKLSSLRAAAGYSRLEPKPNSTRPRRPLNPHG